MRSALLPLALAVAALLPTAVPATPPPATPAAASRTTPATAPPPAPMPSGNPGRASGVRAQDMPPAPPPPNMDLVPADWRPSAPPGVQRANGCALPSPLLASAAQADPLLWGNRLFRLSELWRSAGSRGGGVTLAVIDTGVSAHRLLAGRLSAGGDYVYYGDGTQDCDGHGTAVAGIAAAAPDPLTGFSGVAPGATVLAIRQTSANFSAGGQDEQRPYGVGDIITLARAIVDAVRRGANVINISVVSCQRPSAGNRQAGELQAALHFAVDNNVVVVAAAGNVGEAGCPQTPDDTTVVLPGWYDQDVLTVGAVNDSGTVAGFSYPGPWVDVAAPGQNLMSLSLGGTGVTRWTHDLQSSATVDQPSPIQGTSFAAPAVAGLAVLIRAKYPQLTARQVMDRITATARGSGSGSRDWGIGYGVVDPPAALNTLANGSAVLPPPTTTLATEGHLALTPPPAPDRSRTGALWGGVLGLLAVLAALALGIGKARSGPRRPGPPRRR